MTVSRLPTEAEVDQVAQELLATHRDGGAYPTVTALAARFGIHRITFGRHFPEQCDQMLDTAQQQNQDGKKRRRPQRAEDETDRTLRRLRNDNNNLRRHLEIYEEHIRKLTLENAALRTQLEQSAGVTNLTERRAGRTGYPPVNGPC